VKAGSIESQPPQSLLARCTRTRDATQSSDGEAGKRCGAASAGPTDPGLPSKPHGPQCHATRAHQRVDAKKLTTQVRLSMVQRRWEGFREETAS